MWFRVVPWKHRKSLGAVQITVETENTDSFPVKPAILHRLCSLGWRLWGERRHFPLVLEKLGGESGFPSSHSKESSSYWGRELFTQPFLDKLNTAVCIAVAFHGPNSDWRQSLTCSFQFSSVAQSCPTLCDPMNHSTPGLPVHHQLPEFTQTHAHQVGDAIQPSHSLLSPSPPTPNPSQHQGLFQWVNSLHEVAKVLEFQLQHQSFQWTPRTDLLQDGLVGSPCSPRDSQESFPTPQFKSINFSALSFLHSPILTSIHDHWKNYSLDQMDLCWKSNVSAF